MQDHTGLCSPCIEYEFDIHFMCSMNERVARVEAMSSQKTSAVILEKDGVTLTVEFSTRACDKKWKTENMFWR